MVVLLGDELKNFVESYVKINPAGIDVKPKKIYRIPSDEIDYIVIDGNKRGYYISNNFYKIPENLIEVKPEENYWILDKGFYYVVFPKVIIPKDCIAIAFPRSTFNRLGILKFESALFDPGYEGEFTQTYYFPFKAKINIEEAWIQLVFIRLEKEAKELYKGYWQKEKY